MPDQTRRLILSNGEEYAHDLEKRGYSRAREMPRPFAEARELVRREITTTLARFADLPSRKKYDDEVVLCLRMHPDLTAKSYDPKGIFGVVRDLENVGSRNYKTRAASVAQTDRIKRQLENRIEEVTGRAVFVRSDDAGFRRLLRALDRPESGLADVFKQEIQSIERFDLLQSNEQVQGFPTDWKRGRVELVFHPSVKSEEAQYSFLMDLFRGHDLDWGKTRVVPYAGGPTFVSCLIDRSALMEIAGANPLRAAQPLIFRQLEDLRGIAKFRAPPPPTTGTRSTIKVGMFDGGIDTSLPHLQGHVEQDDALSIKTEPSLSVRCTWNGGRWAILYGPLNDLDTAKPLLAPAVSVVSVRCLPTTDVDPDLYECIDIIENAVPARGDVGFWGLSFGPRGQYREDTISRFTYALDLLAVSHKVGFAPAVGNDGQAGADLDRVQSPSDMVNGLGVGAYTVRNGQILHAPYSCRGPGRECAKNKPDLVAFGGCDQNPFHLLACTPGEKVLSYGTSFAAPLVAAMAGQALGMLERGTALLTRALLLHRAEHPDGEPDHLLGHGLLPRSIDEVLRCGEKEVSIIFQGAIMPKRTKKLRLLLPPDVVTTGNVELAWTVACLPPVSPNHPSDYTALCIEDTFYPNEKVFVFSKRFPNGKTKAVKRHIQDDASEIEELISQGWKQSNFPATDSGNEYQTETERRAFCKWEPLVRRVKVKQAKSLHEPFLTLHAIPRNGATGVSITRSL